MKTLQRKWVIPLGLTVLALAVYPVSVQADVVARSGRSATHIQEDHSGTPPIIIKDPIIVKDPKPKK